MTVDGKDLERMVRVEYAVEHQQKVIDSIVSDLRGLISTVALTNKSVDALTALAASDRRLVKFAIGAGAALFTIAQVVVNLVVK